MKYFGTSFTEHGHYVFEIDGMPTMIKTWERIDNLPFHPEELTINLPNGDVIYYQGGGFTVIGISGSCKDTRPGTKSIFWVEEILTYKEMKDRILDNIIAKKIINSMAFTVKWKK